MKHLFISVALALASVTAAHSNSDVIAVKKAFEAAHIPEDLHITFEPKALLEATYTQPGVDPMTIRPGSTLSKAASALPPIHHISQAHIGNGPFVLALVDPDALTPQNPNVSEIRHFLGGNFFVGKEQPGILVNTTPAITEYVFPHPFEGSDPHRYIYLLYKQSPQFNQQTLITPATNRRYFHMNVFAEEVELGHPLAGTFFKVGPHTTVQL